MNPLFAQSFGKISELKNLATTLRMKNSNETALNLAMSNPQFASFWEKNKNKSVSQICQEYGIDQNMLKEIIG